MGDIKIKPMALFILTKGPSFVKVSFYGVRPHFWAKNGFLGAPRCPRGPTKANLFKINFFRSKLNNSEEYVIDSEN